MSQEQAKQFLDQATQSLQSGQFQQALELIEQSIALDENNSEAHILRGIALSQTGQKDVATDAFRKALMLAPHSAKAYYNLAVHYYQLGQKAEALEMAREAVRSDSQHAGAKDLLSRIELESAPSSGVSAPRVEEPAKPGEPGLEPPPGTGVSSPSEQPRQPSTPYQQPTGGYYRPGYETQGVHSLQFVGNMGKTWDAIGWVLSLLSLVVFIGAIAVVVPMVMEAMRNPNAATSQNPFSLGMSGASMVLELASYGIRLLCFVWMILELMDRRGNWLWLLPFIPCCCCNFPWLIIGIYLLAGRQK